MEATNMETNPEAATEECVDQIQYTDNEFKTTSVIQSFNGLNPPQTFNNSTPINVYDIPLPPSTEYNPQLVENESIIVQAAPVEYTSPNIQETHDTPSEQSTEPSYAESVETSGQSEEYEQTLVVSDELGEESAVNNESAIIKYENTVIAEVPTEDVSKQDDSVMDTSFETESSSIPEHEISEQTLDSKDLEIEPKSETDTSSYETEIQNNTQVEEISTEHIEEEIMEEHEIIQEDEVVEESVHIDGEQTAILTTDGHIQYTVLPPGENSVYQEDGTLVVEYPLHNEVEISQESEIVDEPSEVSIEYVESPAPATTKEGKTPKPKGRKPASYIPLHILGHDINKPVQEVPNGKPALKPRLGVKIPYRNLASQIVSTTELQQQIVERARQKQEAQSNVDVSNSFAKKLTHRLAQSLSGIGKGQKKENTDPKPVVNTYTSIVDIALPINEKPKEINPESVETEDTTIETVEQNVETVEQNVVETVETPTETIIEEPTQSIANISDENIEKPKPEKSAPKIESNSDLIAILEGDGEEASPIVTITKSTDESELDLASEMKNIEKELSLKEQKSVQPPQQVKGKKFFKSRDSRVAEAAKEKAETSKPKESVLSKESTSDLKNLKSRDDESKSKNGDAKALTSPKMSDVKKTPQKDKEREKARIEKKSSYKRGVVEVEPQLKPAMVLKTYTRKRKSNDVPVPEPPKKVLISQTPEESEDSDSKNDFTLPIPPNAYVTKSSRVIKRKVIWDPDEAMPSVRNQSKILSKIETKGSPKVKAIEKKSPGKEKQVEISKNTKPAEKKLVKTVVDEKETPFMKKPEKVETNKIKSPVNVKSATIKTASEAKSSPIPKAGPSKSSTEHTSPGKSPKQRNSKRLTEIDKLLMDEGAVNMLYDINNSDDQKRRASTRISTVATDKAQSQKELLNRTQEIKNELAQSSAVEVATPPKVARKKEAAPMKKNKEMVRKMSKDSSKSSNHSPPPSPATFTPAEASRIIRRHSSDSFSDNDEIMEDSPTDLEETIVVEKPVKKVQPPPTPEVSIITEDETPEKPVKERVKKKADTTPEATPKKKLKKDSANEEAPPKPVEITIKSEPGNVTGEVKTDPTKSFTVVKMNKHYMVNMTYSGGDNYLTIQLLKDLTVTLKELGKNKNCNVVSVHSQGSTFCLGLDYSSLFENDEEIRKKRASELSIAVREFLKCLLNFPKVLVAGIKGDCIGFGVTILPLFDMVIASDSASFSTPYGKLGCAPEAGFLLASPYLSNNGLAAELLYTTQKVNADDAYRRGLVTKLFWPEKFDAEFRALLTHISNLSKPALMATKRQLRQQHCQSVEPMLGSNTRALVQMWISEECQKNFKDYNALTLVIDQ